MPNALVAATAAVVLLLSTDARAGDPRPAPVLRTGQTVCYSESGGVIGCAGTGQDGDVRSGVEHELVDNGDGTITDLVSGLMWEKLSNDGSVHDRDNNYMFESTKTGELNGMAFAGYTDWRVPNVRELESIQDFGRDTDSVVAAFRRGCRKDCTVQECSCTGRDFHWSSTSLQANPLVAWLAGFRFGTIDRAFSKAEGHFVRAVRRDRRVRPQSRPLKTGQRDCFEVVDSVVTEVDCDGTGQDGETRAGARRSFVDNGDGTITDRVTGLMWEKLGRDGSIHDVGNRYTWGEAFSDKVDELNDTSFAGHSDWRVPNVKELASIRTLGRMQTAAFQVFLKSCAEGCSPVECSCSAAGWTSTTFGREPEQAWFVNFGDGAVSLLDKQTELAVRAVRDAQ